MFWVYSVGGVVRGGEATGYRSAAIATVQSYGYGRTEMLQLGGGLLIRRTRGAWVLQRNVIPPVFHRSRTLTTFLFCCV
jgi:hypothetical protein